MFDMVTSMLHGKYQLIVNAKMQEFGATIRFITVVSASLAGNDQP